MPFTEIYPRSYVGNGEATLLTYNHIGPGHYNALIHTEIERMEEVHEANVQQEAAIAIDQQSMTTNSRRSCRCGINTKSNNAAKRKTSDYKSRCKCISQLGSCGPKCKCKGHCGQSGNCRIVDEELKKTRKSSKTKQQTIASSPYKTSRKFYEQRTYSQIKEPFNRLESIVVMLIYITLSRARKGNFEDLTKDVYTVYNKMIEFILEHDFLGYLPLFKKTIEQVQKHVKKN